MMNKTLRTLVISDLFILSSFGLIQPIFAIFILKSIAGATITSVGIAVTIQLFVKAALQILIARWADEERGNCRELYLLIIGSLIICLVPVGYIFTQTIFHLYLIQALHGLGQALSYPSWRVIFARYLSPDHSAVEYGIYDTTTSFGVAITATLGAYFVDTFSFARLFIVVAVMSLVGTAFLVTIFQQEFTCRDALMKRLAPRGFFDFFKIKR